MESLMNHASHRSKSYFRLKHQTVLAIVFSAVFVSTVELAKAQPASLAPWKPHLMPPDIWLDSATRPTAQTTPVSNSPALRTPRHDPSLIFISADEPVVLEGFPPLPRHADFSPSDKLRSMFEKYRSTPPARAPIATTQSAAPSDESSSSEKSKHWNELDSNETKKAIHF
jgi:hypothetical protein